MKRFSIVLSWLVLAIVLAGAHPALAQSPTCQGPSCNGRDPQATNCSADVQVPSDPGSTQTIYDTTGRSVGRMEVRYSPACQAAWARTLITDQQYCPGQLFAQVQRTGDFIAFTTITYVFPNNQAGTGCVLRSPMLYVPSSLLVAANGGAFAQFGASTKFVNPRQ